MPVAPHPQVLMEKFLQTLPNVLWEAKSFPGENHWSVQEYNIEKQKYYYQ